MSTANSKDICAECGELIDTASDKPSKRTPCPKCGSTKRKSVASIVNMQPSDYMLDNYVARGLSKLTVCGVKELAIDKNFVNTFILNSVFRERIPKDIRAYIFNFLRRTEGALAAYREARSSLIEYLETPRNVISPYFRALLHFEVCISQCYQGHELLATATKLKIFEKGQGALEERLHTLYIDSKHMAQMIDGGYIPGDAPAPIWITNFGLETKRAMISYDELREFLLSMGRYAEKLSMLTPSQTSQPQEDTNSSGSTI